MTSDEKNLALANALEPILTCCGLNPSTATETQDDRTIAKMIRLSQKWGYSGLRMVNLFAFRATDPKEMLAAEDPVGPENSVDFLAAESVDFLCAWGADGNHRGRSVQVLAAIRIRFPNVKTYALKVNQNGSPAHPLYLPESLTMKEY